MILDATCGGKLMYEGRDKNFSQNEIVFMDIRQGDFHYTGGGHGQRVTTVAPDKIGSITAIPFEENTFSMVIFDPPHDKFGANSYMHIRYGSWDRSEFTTRIIQANREFYRVLQPQGQLFCKVQSNEHRDKILERELTNFKLLLKISQERSSGHTKSGLKTYWLLFVSKKPLSTGTAGGSPNKIK